jgi:hypothetical protein
VALPCLAFDSTIFHSKPLQFRTFHQKGFLFRIPIAAFAHARRLAQPTSSSLHSTDQKQLSALGDQSLPFFPCIPRFPWFHPPHSATFHEKPLQFRTFHPKIFIGIALPSLLFREAKVGYGHLPLVANLRTGIPPKMRYAYGAKKASLILFASQFRKVSESE